MFSASNYLKGLGWKGPGSGLNDDPKARSKPIIVAQKKTLGGVGRDRDTAFPWWEMAFSSVAKKVSGDEPGPSQQSRKTSTGILSHRAPPALGQVEAVVATSLSDSNTALAHAKIEMARRELYSKFLRGTTLAPVTEDPKVKSSEDSDAKQSGLDKEIKRKKSKKSKHDRTDDTSSGRRKKRKREDSPRKHKKERKSADKSDKSDKESRKKRKSEVETIDKRSKKSKTSRTSKDEKDSKRKDKALKAAQLALEIKK